MELLHVVLRAECGNTTKFADAVTVADLYSVGDLIE